MPEFANQFESFHFSVDDFRLQLHHSRFSVSIDFNRIRNFIIINILIIEIFFFQILQMLDQIVARMVKIFADGFTVKQKGNVVKDLLRIRHLLW